MSVRYLLILVALFASSAACADVPQADPQAVREVAVGRRKVANAAWWGFDPANATNALQSAIRSGARKVIVPNMGREWVVDPIKLVSNQEIVFEPGVVVAARPGGFASLGDCLFSADRQQNIVLRGYGAALRMQKPEYTKGEWRMCLHLGSCTNVQVLGLTLRDSGGDGIYLGNADPQQPYCKDIVVRDCTMDNNRRQGMSVISAVNLLVENCTFRSTKGTAPQAGVDLEPNRANEKLRNCVFRRCTMEANTGAGILVYMGPLDETTEDVSVRFERCRVLGANGSGIAIGGAPHAGPKGSIEFRECLVEGCQGPGLTVASKSTEAVAVRLSRCTFRGVATRLALSPVSLTTWNGQKDLVMGGLEFDACTVEDGADRPWLSVNGAVSGALGEVTGSVTVRNPHGARMSLGEGKRDVRVRVREVR